MLRSGGAIFQLAPVVHPLTTIVSIITKSPSNSKVLVGDVLFPCVLLHEALRGSGFKMNAFICLEKFFSFDREAAKRKLGKSLHALDLVVPIHT